MNGEGGEGGGGAGGGDEDPSRLRVEKGIHGFSFLLLTKFLTFSV